MSLLPPDPLRFKPFLLCEKIGEAWQAPEYEVDGVDLPQPDFMGWAIGAPLISQKIKDIIHSPNYANESNDALEILPFGQIFGIEYFVMNCLRCLDIINFEESSELLEVGPIVLRNCNQPPLVFKCVGSDNGSISRIFCSERFVSMACNNNFTGADFLNPSENLMLYLKQNRA
jgi:hypothetical protein